MIMSSQHYLLTDRSASRRSVAGSRSRIADPRHHDDSLNEEDDSDENWAEVNLCFSLQWDLDLVDSDLVYCRDLDYFCCLTATADRNVKYSAHWI